MKLGRSNVGNDVPELNDIVDSMPFDSNWAPGQLAGCDLADANAGVNVSTSGVRASGGINWTTVALIAGGLWVFRKYFK
jgi:hypothetical protein